MILKPSPSRICRLYDLVPPQPMRPGLAPKLPFAKKLSCGDKKTLGSGFGFSKSEFLYFFFAGPEVLTPGVSARQRRLPPSAELVPRTALDSRLRRPGAGKAPVASDGDRAPALCVKAAAWRRGPPSLRPHLALGVKGEPPTHQPPHVSGGGGWVSGEYAAGGPAPRAPTAMGSVSSMSAQLRILPPSGVTRPRTAGLAALGP